MRRRRTSHCCPTMTLLISASTWETTRLASWRSIIVFSTIGSSAPPRSLSSYQDSHQQQPEGGEQEVFVVFLEFANPAKALDFAGSQENIVEGLRHVRTGIGAIVTPAARIRDQAQGPFVERSEDGPLVFAEQVLHFAVLFADRDIGSCARSDADAVDGDVAFDCLVPCGLEPVAVIFTVGQKDKHLLVPGHSGINLRLAGENDDSVPQRSRDVGAVLQDTLISQVFRSEEH